MLQPVSELRHSYFCRGRTATRWVGIFHSRCAPEPFRRRLLLALPKTFKCPSCTAPLDVSSPSDETARCGYCGSSVMLRDVAAGLFDWDVKGGEPPTLEELQLLNHVAALARRGDKLRAIKFYRRGFGSSLTDAKAAVERLERGENLVFDETHHVIDATDLRAAIGDAVKAMGESLPSGRTVGVAAIVTACVIGLVVLGVVAATFFALSSTRSRPGAPPPPPHSPPLIDRADDSIRSSNPAVAEVVLAFGTDGIGPGNFKDVRSVAVDRSGRIYAAEYSGGRVQIFDGNGAFVSQWMMDPKKIVHRLAADATGISVLETGRVLRFELGTGAPMVSRPGLPGGGFEDLAIGLDGSLTAVLQNENIHRFGADGSTLLEVKDAISSISDRSDPAVRVAVDGAGDIYLLGRFNESVFHYSSTGRFVNRIGSSGNEPGQLRSTHDVAVDHQGRVYVADIGGIVVYAPDGRYLHTFGPTKGLAFGLAFDDKGDLYAACRTFVVKFRLK